MTEEQIDYSPGDPPVPLGTEVEYFGSQAHGRYTVEQWLNPSNHPDYLKPGFDADEAYPDGVAYCLWPVGVPRKFGNRGQSGLYVKRRSFRVEEQ